MALPVTLAGTLVGLGLFLLLENRFVGIAPAGGLQLVGVLRRPSHDRPEPIVTDQAAPPPIAASVRPRPPSTPARGAAVARASITFARPPAPGVDRCRVTARRVPLSSLPGDGHGRERGRLEPGDEVDVIRQEGHYCLVRTPSGAEGWILGLTIVSMPKASRSDGPEA